jgi:hypothetical protein
LNTCRDSRRERKPVEPVAVREANVVGDYRVGDPGVRMHAVRDGVEHRGFDAGVELRTTILTAAEKA